MNKDRIAFVTNNFNIFKKEVAMLIVIGHLMFWAFVVGGLITAAIFVFKHLG